MLLTEVGGARPSLGASVDLAGKYRLIAELGQGGMATVYLAVALGTSGFRKLAVVKLIRPQYAADPDLIEMFLDEARLCARLNHPNIVQTYDVGIDDGQHLMAMEYLDGVSFNAAISRLGRDGGTLNFPLRARVLIEVLEGLRYAHELKDYDGKPLQIVHRDVTPHNIFVTYDGQVKLLDFGIAKAATSSVQTATGVIKGKLTYMAPEQAFGDPVDARADLYAVGVMLWEALTGRRRFPAGLSDAAMFTRVASGELPEAPNAAALGYPAEIDGIIVKSLAPKREDRFQTAAELRAALDAVMQKIPGGSLRELGAMLTASFTEERSRIRQVIEDQFRLIDNGRSTPPPSMGLLPTVSPPKGTDSLLRERGSPPRSAGDIIIPIESGTSRGLSTIARLSSESKPRGRIFLLAGLGAAGVIGVLTAGQHLIGRHDAVPVPLVVQPQATASVAISTPPKPLGTADEAPTAATVAPRHPSEDMANVTPVQRPAAVVNVGHHPRPTTVGREPAAAPEPAVDAAPVNTAEPASTDLPMGPRPTRPKVHLDPDNPFGK
jgi:eukaryotic-like serine/threonine-protein kinase